MSQEEVVFFNKGTTKVTSARVIVGGKTFAMAGITSVEVRKILPNTSYLPGLLAFFAGLGTTQSNMGAGIGILLLGIAMLWYQTSKPIKYALVLRAAGGEVNALESEKEKDIDVIASAITDAIVHRG